MSKSVDFVDDFRCSGDSTVQKYYQGQLAQMVKEIQAMVELRGKPHIVSYEEHKIVEKEEGIGYDLFLRMELLTSLPEYINQHGNLNRTEVIKLGIQMAKALEVLEARNLIHRYSVTLIGPEAFSGCESLASVSIPNPKTVMANDAFWYCPNLVLRIMPDSAAVLSNHVRNLGLR